LSSHLIHDQNKTFKDLNAIDVGCGAGILSESLARLNLGKVTGIDPTPKCIELAKEHLAMSRKVDELNVEYVNTTLEQHLQKEQTYDLVCCSEVIEHVSNQKEFAKDLTKLVKPNGLLFMSSIGKTPEGYFLNIVMGEHVLGLMPKGTHEWDQLITVETLEQYLQAS
jgi:ubiquinone biosynthesis O-methyltransferase